jgi:hypothetical protein
LEVFTVEVLQINRPRMGRLRRLWLRNGKHPQQKEIAYGSAIALEGPNLLPKFAVGCGSPRRTRTVVREELAKDSFMSMWNCQVR